MNILGDLGFNTKSSNKVGVIAGATIGAVGALANISAQKDYRNEIYNQIGLANQQYDLQYRQIMSNRDIADLSSLDNANQQLSTQLSKIGATGISMASGAFGAIVDDTIRNQKIASFSADMTATVQKLNVSFAKSSMLSQAREKISASEKSSAMGLVSGGLSIASALAIL
jgi:hypothetical protein